MISKTIRILNFLLKPAGAKIVSTIADNFDMHSAMKRIHSHRIIIDNVIDIGGSDGTWSRQAIKIFPKASFLAIEPLTEREAALSRLAGTHPNFGYEICAAGETDGGQAKLNIADDLDGSTIDGHGGKSRQVPLRTVDSIVSDRNLIGSFLLKFDTHGYEVPILQGASETLKKTLVIIMEAYNFKITKKSLRFHEMCIYMEELGFRCYDVAGLMLREYDQAFWQMDLCFIRDDVKIFEYSGFR